MTNTYDKYFFNPGDLLRYKKREPVWITTQWNDKRRIFEIKRNDILLYIESTYISYNTVFYPAQEYDSIKVCFLYKEEVISFHFRNVKTVFNKKIKSQAFHDSIRNFKKRFSYCV